MTYFSSVQCRGKVTFPEFTGERIYMQEFTKAGGLPTVLKRWQPTVDAMLDGVDTDGPIFLMVDQAPVKAATTHRRPGVHVDGHWEPTIYAHDISGGHIITPGDLHKFPRTHVHIPQKQPGKGKGNKPVPVEKLRFPKLRFSESLLLASNVMGCVAYDGRYTGEPGEGGDCSHIDLSRLTVVDMEPGKVWAGDALHMLHESVPITKDCLRTVVRLNVKGWIPQ